VRVAWFASWQYVRDSCDDYRRVVTGIQSLIFIRGTDMKYILILSIFAILLGGCAVVPAGYGDNRGGYYQERGYYHGDNNYRARDYNRGDGYYRDYGRERGG
jgi:hypothetical protein